MGSWGRIRCTVSQGAIAASFPDGRNVEIPPDMVSRSQTLHNMITASSSSGEFELMAPVAWLEKWMQCAAVTEHGNISFQVLDITSAVLCLLVRSLCLVRELEQR